MKHEVIERRSLAMHTLIAQRLAQNPEILRGAQNFLDKALQQNAPGVHPALRAWQSILDQDIATICHFLQSPSEKATQLRQSSPFAGTTFISNQERWKILRDIS